MVLLEIIYLVVFNVALNTTFAQNRVNNIEPEKFQLQWGSAWTPYPTRVHMEKLTAKGRSGSKEWQVDVDTASASLSLLSLMGHKIKVCNIELGNITYAQQQLEESDASTQLTGTQRGETSKTTIEAMDKSSDPWHVDLRGVRVHGHHTVETSQFKGELDGDIDTDLALSTKNGLLSVKNGKINIVINTLKNHKAQEILKQGKIESIFKISPVAFREKRRGELLKYLALDSAITAQMENLDIFNTHLERSRKIQLSGKGALESQIHLSKGKLLPGTKLQIDARKLSVIKRDYLVRGEGKVISVVTKENPDILDSKVLFGNFHTYRLEDEKGTEGSEKREIAFFQGNGLSINSKASSTLYPKPSKGAPVTYVGLELPPVTINDLSLLQQYIPEKWHMKITGGKGMLQGKIDIVQKELNASLNLSSNETEIALGEQYLQSDLDLAIKVKVPTTPSLYADLSGTYIALNNTRLSSQKVSDKRESKPWNTRLKIEKGTVTLPLPEKNTAMPLSEIVKKYKIKDILAGAEGKIEVMGDISRLDWVNLLSKSSLDLSLSGSGIINADLLVKKGSLVEKSMANVISKNLEVGLLDYQFKGNGRLTIMKGGGEKNPLLYALEYENATMKRKNEKEAMTDNVAMKLNRSADNLSFRGSRWDKPLRMQILSAKVKSVTLYNQYFPENSPFSFIEGSADLSADIVLESNNTKGYVKLITDGLTMKVDDQNISARLRLDTKIVGGEPQKMKFDISGSSIVLDQAKVAGKNARYTKDDWSTDIKLKKAEIVWRKPIQLKSEMLLAIKDSRPIVAMIDNKRAKFALVSNLLIVENLQGETIINMSDNAITIPYALVKSNQIDIGAKGIITPTLRNGIFFFGHKHIKAVMEIRDGKRSFDIFNAQKSFDSFVVPSPAP